MDKAIATGLYTDATIETMRAAYYNAWQRVRAPYYPPHGSEQSLGM